MRKDYEYYYYQKEVGSKLLQDNTEMEIEVRDPETLKYTVLKGIVHRDSENYPNADLLWVKTEKGQEEKPWVIETELSKSDEEEIIVQAKPHVRIAYGGKKGRMLFDMLKEREDKKGK